jgi:hypothetical protein
MPLPRPQVYRARQGIEEHWLGIELAVFDRQQAFGQIEHPFE